MSQTQTATEAAEFYDTLTQGEQDLHDKIGALGYRIDRVDSGYEAHKPGSPSFYGNCATLHELWTVISQSDASDEVENNATDSPAGDGFLFPGMKPKQQAACADLVTAILNYESYKRERVDALAKEVEAKAEVVGLMRANKDKLAFDPKTGIRSYRVNDYIEELVPGEEKLKSRRASDEDDE